MPAAYSYDLRKKAMEALEEGGSRETVAARFKIGRTTLWEWQQRRKETGDFQSKKLGNERLCRKWLNFGATLVSKRSTELSEKLDLRAKKDIWIQGKKRRKTC